MGRWAVSAAHCYDKYGYNDEDEKRRTLRIRVGTQFEESVEVRSVYRHPDYRTRRLYNDVAVLELGRRIEYDFERFGDSPTCKGDSGGPLFLEGGKRRKTLVGIVSGGVSCGNSYPSWLTRVEYFSKWIRCILEQAVRFKNQYDKVSQQCKRVVPDQLKCEEAIADPEISLFKLRGVRDL